MNLFDKAKANTSGYYNATTGNFIASTAYWASDFIPALPNDKFVVTNSGHVTFWDENRNFVSGTTASQPYVIPNNTAIKYARFTINASSINTAMIVKGEVLPTSFIPPYTYSLISELEASNKSKLQGLKWAVLGDSITSTAYADTPYWKVLADKNNMLVYNHGISGSRVAVSAGHEQPMVNRYTNMPNDADIITVFGGINDYSNDVPLGDIASTDTATFYGALNVMISGLIKKYQGKRIGYITPMQRRGVDRPKIDKYIAAVKEVCKKYSVPVLDMFSSGGLSPDIDEINAEFFFDGLHPNNKGQSVMARPIESFIESL